MASRVGSYFRVAVLAWADDVTTYSLWNIMAFLSIVWNFNFTHAAGIVCVLVGSTRVMLFIMAFLVDTFLGHYWLLCLTSISFSIGWSFFAISTSTIFTSISCSSGPLCVGDLQWSLFYTSIALIALGIAGHATSIEPFLVNQLLIRSGEDEEQREREMPQIAGGVFMTICIRFVCILVLPFVKPWGVRFGFPAVCMVSATYLFLRGSSSYIRERPHGSPIMHVFRVIVASFLKIWWPIPRDSRQLYEKYEDGNVEMLPHTNCLRFLDKAALLSQSQTIHEQVNQKWRLCSVTEVEETKIFVQMIPMWMSFITLGLVLSIGNTYFFQQAITMNQKYTFFTIPFLLFFHEFSKSLSPNIYLFSANMASIFGYFKQKYIPAIGIGVGMSISIFCCVIAALVECRRLKVTEKHGLLDDTPMSILWLIPQFVLLGAFEGIADSSISLFLAVQAPNSMKKYMILITDGVFGLGIIGSVLSVYISGKSWFGDTLNKSRLDKYYWMLATMGCVNLLFYGLVAFGFPYKELNSSTDEQQLIDEEMTEAHYHEE